MTNRAANVAAAARTLGRRLARSEIGTAEAAGVAAAVASIGPSFQRGLLPRSTGQQAIITGVAAAANYGLTVTTQSFVQAFTRRVVGGEKTRRGVSLAANALAIGAGIGAQRVARQHPRERLRRALVRTLGWRFAIGALAGSVVGLADAVSDAAGDDNSEELVDVPLVVLAGAAVGAAFYLQQRRELAAEDVERDATGVPVEQSTVVSVRRAVVIGSGISIGLYLASLGESALARVVGRGVSWAAPSLAPVGHAIGHATTLWLSGYGGYRAVKMAYASTEQAGVAIEPAYSSVPQSPFVSGSKDSLVDWNDIGREGRRFVNMALTANDISAVVGEPARDPIRIFVGLASAETSGERADLAMRELERTGAFERSTLAYFSPTGTGYINYVGVETLEYLTRGDVASVGIQYSVRPSFLSLDRVRAAWEDNLSFLTALSWRLRSMPEDRRPRLVLFGESLGSQAAQDVFLRQGSRGLHIYGIERALFVGSPYASKWRQAWLDNPQRWDPDGQVVELSSYEEWLALPDQARDAARIVLLTHHDDPIPKFGAPLLIQAPPWMGPRATRAPGVPHETVWRPLATFVITLVDLLNADHAKPGHFEAFGHDYRKDIAEFVRLSFRIDADNSTMERVEKALRERELMWAQRRLATAQLQRAEHAVRKQLDSWGVDTGSVGPLVTPAHDPDVDPYAAGRQSTDESRQSSRV